MSSTWTESDYDSMGWHDTTVHAIRIVEGKYGSGEFWIDLDYIVEWICVGNTCRFRVAPALLVFREVTKLRLTLDYATVGAGLVPFQLDGIARNETARTASYGSYSWTIEIGWPDGSIAFDSPGFTQKLTGPIIETESQSLSPSQRGQAAFHPDRQA